MEDDQVEVAGGGGGDDGGAEGSSQELPKTSDGLPCVGPPSPLTGCYLLIVIGEPHSAEHKDIILQRLIKGKEETLVN